MMRGETTQRSALDPEHLTGVLRSQGAAALRAEPELTLVLDGMELRRPEAAAQAHLMRVKALDGHWVNGYRSFNVLGLGEGKARGLLSHQLFSSNAPGFRSENQIIADAIAATEGALHDFAGPKTWAVDCGFDNDDVWWQIWGYPGSHVVCRLYHFERIVLWQTPAGTWEERYLDATFKHLRPLAVIETELEVRKHGQPRPKRQTITAQLSAVPLRVYAPEDHRRTQPVWLVRVNLNDCVNDPWYLLTDWPVADAASVQRVFRFYRRRWAVEDLFKFIKTCLGIEDVQLLDYDAIRTLVAFAWVAAGFLLHLGLTLDHAEVRLLAYLGGWEERPNRPPGKTILTRGLRRLLDLLVTQAVLQAHVREHGDLPPFVQRLLAAFPDRSHP